MPKQFILVAGARQNNLKGFTLRLPLNELIVVTGVSGSGKSSLAFDTIYAEGQRRYVETFSPYARQFLERMDKPRVDCIQGIPPAIAIDQVNPVRTSRSTVGTMTELNDHLKLLFARAADLYCRCGRLVRRDTPESIFTRLAAETARGTTVLITFPVSIPQNISEDEVIRLLARQGYQKVRRVGDRLLEVVQDRTEFAENKRARIIDALETALQHESGQVTVHLLGARERVLHTLRFSSDLHCPDCDLHYRDPFPNLFSFNSPLGACETCRGFGRIIGIDYGLVIPDDTRTLAEGAIRPWQTESYRECQEDLVRFARRRGVPIDIPWRDLDDRHRQWVIEGEGDWEAGVWYGVRRFFEWLVTKSYRMHIRVLLSRYRAYRECPACGGARLKPEALQWRLGPERLNMHDIARMPIAKAYDFFRELRLAAPLDEATEVLQNEIRTRLRYLVEVGLGYLTLDRQSRTLSGGEVQRINLTTALGTSLVNTLFVLDEPSIGLHPRDIGRLICVLRRLCDAGNTLLVVEHDPQVIMAADCIVELGPGPGEHGGEVVFRGKAARLLSTARSLTARYLRKDKQVSRRQVGGHRAVNFRSLPGNASASGTQGAAPLCLRVLGAAANNLKGIDVEIPLRRLVCVTGVSGSGKSTLVEEVLYRGLRRLKRKPAEPPGRHRGIEGAELVKDVVLVDQAPIGKTARSNPASYVGAFDAIREIFAAEPLAAERGYTASTFSFNSGNGRCPTCRGNGFERVEMQFLSDVYIRCPDCDGRRFRPEVLEVKIAGVGATRASSGGALKSVADVLDMTVTEACDFFSGYPQVRSRLAPLQAVGLGYLRLGQPVPTLSGGEAQRLKLAGELARQGGAGAVWTPETAMGAVGCPVQDPVQERKHGEAGTSAPGGVLYLLDEPTTGLHLHDVATLLQALRTLIDAGHSVVVIEHNLEVIQAADWIIDLGPEGGDDGGRVVCVGPPGEVRRHPHSHTGAALRGQQPAVDPGSPCVTGEGERVPAGRRSGDRGRSRAIEIHNARQHNLKNIDVSIPREKFTVITGVSGSGKSSLAFDILFAEGQRRYLESLNAYARQFVQPATKPDVDAIYGIPPTVAIEQRTSRGGRKSTVGTVTEVYHFLRLLFVKLGVQHCPECRIPIEPRPLESVVAKILRQYRGKRITLWAPLVIARKGYYTALARWAAARGWAHLRVDGALTPTSSWPRLDRFKEHTIELPVGTCKVDPAGEADLRTLVERAVEYGKGVVYVATDDGTPGEESEKVFSVKRACPRCGRSFENLDPRLFSYNSKHGWCLHCYGTGEILAGFDADQTGEEIWWNEWWDGETAVCPECQGKRLRPEALAVLFMGKSIADMTAMSVAEAARYFDNLNLHGRAAEIARDILPEIRSRLAFLMEVGLPYLTLDRGAPTLSGGEARRIRLAAQLGSNLRGVCYILDEPTIGLHPRDDQLLLGTLRKLKKKGNTVVVVEHDEETVRSADHVIDLGPGGGVNGGRVVGVGTVRDLERNERSVTGRYLRTPLQHPLRPQGTDVAVRRTAGAGLRIVGADLHNLKKIDVRIPLGRFVCVTGVSGSGKSTLVREVLYENVRRLVRDPKDVKVSGCTKIEGYRGIRRVLEVDQTPIGKTPRSCPATYVGFWDDIRRLFAQTPEARLRGYEAGRFSFNLRGGRCEACEGQGVRTIEMSFLSDVTVLCEECNGTRFAAETLAVRYRGKSIADVLAMSVDEAVEFFSAHKPIYQPLRLLQDVGLGYLTLGQPSPTLSGGEAQRIKLVTELAKVRLDGGPAAGGGAGGALYVLDEPTIGLHMADVEKLIHILHRLVAAGNTVVIIEHNLDVIAEADWVIDLGPEGGEGGGYIVAEGPPEKLAASPNGSYTAMFLAKFLGKRGLKPKAPETPRRRPGS